MADRISESNRHENETFEPGQLLTLTQGDYDEVQDYGPYEVLRQFTNHEVLQAFIDAYEARDVFGPSPMDVVSFMLEQGYIGEPEVQSVSWRVDEHLQALAKERGKGRR